MFSFPIFLNYRSDFEYSKDRQGRLLSQYRKKIFRFYPVVQNQSIITKVIFCKINNLFVLIIEFCTICFDHIYHQNSSQINPANAYPLKYVSMFYFMSLKEFVQHKMFLDTWSSTALWQAYHGISSKRKMTLTFSEANNCWLCFQLHLPYWDVV